MADGHDGAATSHAAEARATWSALDEPWQLAFDEAWASWCAGNFGIGAALVDPATGGVVSVGRNRVAQRDRAPGLLTGNFTAHAEMNAFAAMDRMLASGLHLYTTLQPCLMCAGTSIQLGVERVHYAAPDGYFTDLHDLWQHHDYTRDRQPAWVGPLGGRLERFARVLPLSFLLFWAEDADPAEWARRHEPAATALAGRLVDDRDLLAVLDRAGPAVEALAVLWERLG